MAPAGAAAAPEPELAAAPEPELAAELAEEALPEPDDEPELADGAKPGGMPIFAFASACFA